MPYEGEFASYQPLRRVAESERVRQLLMRSRVSKPSEAGAQVSPVQVPETDLPLPEFVVAIDGSSSEVDVVNGYPGAKVGYCTVASVLIDLKRLNALDEHRPINPVEFRQTEKASTIDSALPGSNVVTRNNHSARDSFREALFEIFHGEVIDDDDDKSLLETYEELLKLKPLSRPQACPYSDDGCERHFFVPTGSSNCPCDKQRPIYSTDALRIHERFRNTGSNGEALGEIMQVWERLLVIHLLRCLERRGWLANVHRIAFVIDGPLALFGHPAWLSAAISAELKRINKIVREQTGQDLLLFGVEKSGTFVQHFEEIDQMEERIDEGNRPEGQGATRFPPRSCYMPTDRYIKRFVIYSESEKRYGLDTYFGRKFFYKSASGSSIVANIPFLTQEQDSLDSSDISLYPQIPQVCDLLDRLASARYPNAFSPIVSAHAHAAIPLNLGAKVLQQLARALMRKSD